jgi:plasmid replication initiation protein
MENIRVVSKTENRIKSYIIVKNDLIESASRLTRLEHHILIYAISALRKSDTHFKVLRFHLKDMVKDLELTSSGYSQIIKATKSLAVKTVTVRRSDDKEEKDHQMVWCPTVTTTKNKIDPEKGYIDIKFNDDLAPYLLNIKNKYLQTANKPLLQVRNTYGVKLLLYLRKWWNFYEDGIKTHKVPIEKFREILGLDNFPDAKDMYKDYPNFRRRVLDPAINEINDKSDILVTCETQSRKDKRKVESLVFKFAEKKDFEDLEDFLGVINYIVKRDKIGE